MRRPAFGWVYTNPSPWSGFVRVTATWLAIITVALVISHVCGEAATADDGALVTAGPDVAVELSVDHACPFSAGWNLTVLNGTPEDLPPCVQTVWYYDGLAERWYFWGRNNWPFWNDLTSFDITRGYWVWSR